MSTRVCRHQGWSFTKLPCFDMLRSMCSRFAKYVGLIFRVLWSSLFDEAYLRRLAELYVTTRIDNWIELGRLTEDEARQLLDRTHLPTVTEYLKGFVIHLEFNIVELPVINNVVVISLAVVLSQLMILLYYFLSPLLRTVYTLSRMLRNRRSGISYGTALFVGMIPKIGTFAYPAQMVTAYPALSRFLVRSQVSTLAATVPLIGGTDSRLDRFAIRTADFGLSVSYYVVRLMDKVGSAAFGWLKR
ncbi:MAG: hypothetical protein R6U37_06550 [Dehalococcoidia bacterium]